VILPDGEYVQVAVPEMTAKNLAALDDFKAAYEEHTEEQGRKMRQFIDGRGSETANLTYVRIYA